MDIQKKMAWLARVEDLINVLEGSSISEMELTEGGTEIVIRRKPGMVMAAIPAQGNGTPNGQAASLSALADKRSPIVSPLTGVYYSAASPTSPPFVTIGDVVQKGQVVALVEAMKVFNEITADITGRVVNFVANTGEVIQKGDVLLQVEPL